MKFNFVRATITTIFKSLLVIAIAIDDASLKIPSHHFINISEHKTYNKKRAFAQRIKLDYGPSFFNKYDLSLYHG
jgi:hypothetical protein